MKLYHKHKHSHLTFSANIFMASVRQRLENEGRHSIASNSAPNKTLMVVVCTDLCMPDLVPREPAETHLALLSSSEGEWSSKFKP